MKELILGGARSGKSALAMQHATESKLDVTFIATATAGDDEMITRIEHHKKERPAHWQLTEEPVALADTLLKHADTQRCLIVDCLTLWLSNFFVDDQFDETQYFLQKEHLLGVLPQLPGHIIFVSNEVGFGITPLGEINRRFVDEAGRLHQQLATICDRATLTVAGLPLPLPSALKEQNVIAPPEAAILTNTPVASSTTGKLNSWLEKPARPTNSKTRRAALARQSQLTKPPGALSQLEEIAVQLAAMQGSEKPTADKINIVVFAADHGIAVEGISAFPQAVTGEMIKNFAAGGAAINVIAKHLNAKLEVVNLGCVNDPGDLPGVVTCTLAAGTANASKQPAMTEQQLKDALNAGRDAVLRAQQHCEIFIGGDMGIGNTTTSTAVSCALLGQPACTLVGPGTGLDSEGVAHKARIIQRALDLHSPNANNPLEVLRCLGGFEIAALTGAFITCAQEGLPVLVDGFIAGCAALVATRYAPGVRDWMIFGHCSAEPGHRRILEALDAKPLLDLGLRLGEGSGAAAAVPLVRLACSLHNEMATFAEAGVSDAH